MEQVKPVAVRLSSIAHATEVSSNVLKAISNVCPSGFSRKFETTRAKGHFGNEITVFRLSARSVSQAESFLRCVLKRLPYVDREMLQEKLEEHLDSSGSFHLRFDKQEASQGILQLGDHDAIKAEVAFGSRGTTANILREEVAVELRQLLDRSLETTGSRTGKADY